MAENRPMFWRWLDNMGTPYNRNLPPSTVGVGMQPQQLKYAMPPMRDSQVVPTIDQAAGPAPAYPTVTADQIMRQLMVPGGAPSGGSMADARAQEIAYANSMAPRTMADARAQEIAYANSQPNPAARGSGGGGGVPMPPTRPEEFGSRPILYTVDFGDGSPVRQFLAKDGMAPNIPGANVYADQSYDPSAGALAKFIRGAF